MNEFKKGRNNPIHNLTFGKIPPQAPDLEEAVLGACLLEKEAFELTLAILEEPEYFYVDAHEKIYRAMLHLYQIGSAIDLLTVMEELRKRSELEQIGGMYFLTNLTSSVLSSAHVENHARIISEKYILRKLISIAGSIINSAYDESTDAFELLDRAESEITGVSIKNIKTSFYDSAQVVKETSDEVELASKRDDSLIGVTSGYNSLDKVTHGWQQTDLIILAARSSVGKTAFALNLAKNASEVYQPVGIFSCEMMKTVIMKRLLSAESKVPLSDLITGKMSTDNYSKYITAAEKLAGIKMFIDDTASISLFDLRSKARRMVMKHGVRMIIIDYLQLIVGKEFNIREQEIAFITKSLKSLAKELQIPIIALAQLNRTVDSRTDKRPKMSDLRESGAIEQDADIIMLLSRPDYQAKEGEIDPLLQGKMLCDIVKHRNGATQEVPLLFDKTVQCVMEIPVDYYEKNIKPDNPSAGIRKPHTPPVESFYETKNKSVIEDLPF